MIPAVAAAWAAGLKPEPQLTVTEWADRHRMLPPQVAEPGRWRTSRTPYLREIMDALSVSHPAETVVFQASAQVGKTETGLNWLGYCIHHAPGTILLVWPSEDTIKRNVTERIDPLIEHCPALKDLVTEKKSRDAGNTTHKKSFPGGTLHLVSAQSAIALRSLPVRFLFLDEVDAFPPAVGKDGDPAQLAIRRTQTFRGRRKIFMCSTPSLRGASRIEAAYLESDQRVYEVPCPHCGAFHELRWADIRWPEGRPDLASWWCPTCGVETLERHKAAMVQAGRWRATAPGGKVAGFRISALVSPFATWGEIASEFLAVKNDPSRLREWVNNALGETWEEKDGDGVSADGLAARREGWTLLPAGVVVVTAGVDVQVDRIEVTFVGWGAHGESWVLRHVVVWGDPSVPAVWNDLDSLLSTTFEHALDLPEPLPVRAACVDTGGAHTMASYSWLRGKERRRIWGVKGSSSAGAPLWPRKPTKTRGKVNIFMVGTNTAKETLYARLKIEQPGPGFIHLHNSLSDDFLTQLTAEKVRTKYLRGQPVREWFLPEKRRNEALDTYVYASAALAGLESMGLDVAKEAARLAECHAPRNTNLPVEGVKTSGSSAPTPPPRRPAILARSSYLG